MQTVPIPGGTANFRERGHDEIPGRSVKLIRAAALAAASELADYPQLFEPPREGETDEQRQERLGESLKDMVLSTEQAMSWDNVREATAVAMLASWSLDRPLPTLATIGDLPEDLYDALLTAVGGVSAGELETDFTPKIAKRDPVTGEEFPTGASDASNGPSEATPSNLSTQTPENAGESTGTDLSTP